jgi:hypothetical protein
MGARIKASQKEIKRPNTTAMGQKPPRGTAMAGRPFTGISGLKSMPMGNFTVGRGLSANYAAQNPKLRKFENLI